MPARSSLEGNVEQIYIIAHFLQIDAVIQACTEYLLEHCVYTTKDGSGVRHRKLLVQGVGLFQLYPGGEQQRAALMSKLDLLPLSDATLHHLLDSVLDMDMAKALVECKQAEHKLCQTQVSCHHLQ